MARDFDVSAAELSDVLGVREREVRYLAAEGILRKVTDDSGHEVRGHYWLKQSTKRYIQLIKAKKSANQTRESTLDDLRSQKMRLQVMREKMNVSLQRGELVPKAAFVELMGPCMNAARDTLRGMANKLTQQLSGMTDEAAIFTLIMAEVDAALHNVADQATAPIAAQVEAAGAVTDDDDAFLDDLGDQPDDPNDEPDPDL